MGHGGDPSSYLKKQKLREKVRKPEVKLGGGGHTVIFWLLLLRDTQHMAFLAAAVYGAVGTWLLIPTPDLGAVICTLGCPPRSNGNNATYIVIFVAVGRIK